MEDHPNPQVNDDQPADDPIRKLSWMTEEQRKAHYLEGLKKLRKRQYRRGKKPFNCVEFQHKSGEKYMRMLDRMTPEEREAYYAKAAEEFREFQAKARAKRGLPPLLER